MHRSKQTMTYHGRTGHPYIHETEKGKKFIMVRKQGGGTKRLYLTTRARRLLLSKKGYPR